MLALRNIIDFAIRMVSDVYIGGENVMWAAAVNAIGMASSGFLMLSKYGQKLFGDCIGRFGGCFVAGTPVVTGFIDDSFAFDPAHSPNGGAAIATQRSTITKPIESIELGSRVITEAPDWLPRDGEFGEPEQATWRQVNLLQHRGDGTVIEMELIRPQWWINLAGLKVGTIFELPFPELQTVGTASVLSFADCPPIQSGEGDVVIGRFVTRAATNFMTVTLEGGSEFTGTNLHPVWSIDTNDWKRIDEFQIGERLSTRDGPQNIVDIITCLKTKDVFNVEVFGNHVYRVLNEGILVHNAGVDYAAIPLTYSVSTLASRLGTAIGEVAHHVIPNSLRDDFPLLFQKASDNNWHIDGLLNRKT